MGLFDNMKINKMGQNAYNAHVQANDLFRRGRMAEARAQFDEAYRLYGEAYAAGFRKTGVLMSYSVLMMRRGEFERARELMKEISSLDPKMNEDTHFELRINYSICLWRLGILDKAIETIRYAGRHCKNSSYYTSLGTYLVEMAGQTGAQEDYEEARVFLDAAMEYDDEDAATLDNYGLYHHFLSLKARSAGDEAEYAAQRKTAIDYYEKARAQKPGQITTLYALAKYAIEDGDAAKAREHIDKALMHSASRICPVSTEDLMALKAQLA